MRGKEYNLQFIHFIILPLMVFIFSVLLQKSFNRDEFIQYYKVYLLGLIAGLLILFIFHLIDPVFYQSAHYFTILIKSIFVYGILFTLLTVVVLLTFFHFGKNIKHSDSWSLVSILSFSYISGIYTIINIYESNTGNNPDYLIHYFAFIPFLLFVSLIIGLGLYNYINEYRIYLKIIWVFITIVIIILSFSSYYFLIFYNFIYQYIYLLLFVGLYMIFEFNDFKAFRK